MDPITVCLAFLFFLILLIMLALLSGMFFQLGAKYLKKTDYTFSSLLCSCKLAEGLFVGALLNCVTATVAFFIIGPDYGHSHPFAYASKMFFALGLILPLICYLYGRLRVRKTRQETYEIIEHERIKWLDLQQRAEDARSSARKEYIPLAESQKKLTEDLKALEATEISAEQDYAPLKQALEALKDFENSPHTTMP